MQQYEIQKLRQLPIEAVAERLGLTPLHHKCLCPFHTDHHPSLSFNTRRNTYRCFVCGASGDTISLARHILGTSFTDTCRRLATDGGIILSQAEKQQHEHAPSAEKPHTFDAHRYERFFLHPWLSPQAQQFLYSDRHIDPRVVGFCRLSSWLDRHGNPWLQIPYFAPDGKLIGIQNRNLTPSAQPRFRFPAGSKCGIYNLAILPRLQPSDQLFITEGCSDCWAMLSAGHKAIAIPSATLLHSADTKLIRQIADSLHLSLHMYPDQDLPGETLFMQLKQMLPGLVRHQLPPGCKDFADAWKLRSRC